MVTTPKRGRRPEHPDRRESILEAALACFVERGFYGTAIPQIGDRADGARRRSLHRNDARALGGPHPAHRRDDPRRRASVLGRGRARPIARRPLTECRRWTALLRLTACSSLGGTRNPAAILVDLR